MRQRDGLDLARVLLARAIDDETIVRKALTDSEIADSIAGFHAQQSTEKLVKAVLAAHGMAFAKSHDLEYLIDLVAQGGIAGPEGIRDAEALTPWAVESRYEGEQPPALDRKSSLALVEQLRSWAESEIETAGQQQTEPEAQDDEPRQPEQG
jgi:HEPN domain-containing protein